MEDLVSIVVPVYNVEKYLGKCIESIINQTYQKLEIILVDDGSTDKSAEIMKHYGEIDKRIINIFKENFGAPSARNRGSDIATGKYIMFFDSDDELYENAIEDMLNKIQDADIIIGNWCSIDLNNNVVYLEKKFNNEMYNRDILKEIIKFNPIPGSKLYKSEIIKNNNLYFDNVRIGQDLNFYIKYVCCCNKFATTENIIFKYRITDDSISRVRNLNIFDIVNSIEKVNSFLKKNENKSLDEATLNELKVSHYGYYLNKIVNYDKKYREIIRLYFYSELKKINIENCSLEIKKKYKRIVLKCKIFKFINPKKYNEIVKKYIRRKKSEG